MSDFDFIDAMVNRCPHANRYHDLQMDFYVDNLD